MQVDLVCVGVAAAIALGSYALGWLGGHAIGRYKGERGRRQAAEAYLTLGAPNAQPARKVAMKNAPLLEAAMAPQGFDKNTVERGKQEIMAAAKDAGSPLSEDQATAMAHDMLREAMYGGGAEDDTIALG